MKNLATITDREVSGEEIVFPAEHRERTAARAIFTDADGKVALLHVAKGRFHKLPGGGVKHGEEVLAALDRELLEETGCQATIVGEVGQVIEYRAKVPLLQTSYCYKAQVVGSKSEPTFTKKETEEGASLLWVPSVADAVKLLESDEPSDWEGQFIVKRDLIFLKEAL